MTKRNTAYTHGPECGLIVGLDNEIMTDGETVDTLNAQAATIARLEGEKSPFNIESLRMGIQSLLETWDDGDWKIPDGTHVDRLRAADFEARQYKQKAIDQDATIERLEGIIEGHDLVTMKLARQAATIARLEGERDRFRANAVRAYAALGWGCDFATVEDLKGGDDETSR